MKFLRTDYMKRETISDAELAAEQLSDAEYDAIIEAEQAAADAKFPQPKSMAVTFARRYGKSFGDPGNTQERAEHGRFGAAADDVSRTALETVLPGMTKPITELTHEQRTFLTDIATSWAATSGVPGSDKWSTDRTILEYFRNTALAGAAAASNDARYSPNENRQDAAARMRWVNAQYDRALAGGADTRLAVIAREPYQAYPGAGWSVGGSVAGPTDAGMDGMEAAATPLLDDDANPKKDVELKADNVERISGSLREQADKDPAVKSQLEAIGQRLIDTAPAVTDYANRYLGIPDLGANNEHLPWPSAVEVGSRELATRMQDTWMHTASDSNALSWGLQLAAAELTGASRTAADEYFSHGPLQSDDWGQAVGLEPLNRSYVGEGGAAHVPDDDSLKAQAERIAASPAVQAYVATVYADTQAMLKDQGVEEVTLYRGVQFTANPDDELPFEPGDEPQAPVDPFMGDLSEREEIVDLNPLSSFSTNLETATYEFGSASDNINGYTMTTTVPADRIFSSALTGPGCMVEQEFLVIGGATNVWLEPDSANATSAREEWPPAVNPDFHIEGSLDDGTYHVVAQPGYTEAGLSLKSFGDAGNTQERSEHGRFGPAADVTVAAVERVLHGAGITRNTNRGYDSHGTSVYDRVDYPGGGEPVHTLEVSYQTSRFDRPIEEHMTTIQDALANAGYSSVLNESGWNPKVEVTGGPVPELFGQAFDTKEEADTWGRNTQGWVADLKPDDFTALANYTTWVGVNAGLRNPSIGLDEQQQHTRDGLDRIFKDPAARIPEDVTTYRSWVGRGPLKEIGATFTDRAYTSTALPRDEMMKFHDSYKLEVDINNKQLNPVMVRIDVPAGTRAIFLGETPSGVTNSLTATGANWFADNSELLIDRGTKYQVVGYDADGSIHLKVVGQRAQK